MPHPGQVVGPYVVDESLGTGSSAHVFRAHTEDGTAVALKLLSFDNDRIKARLLREANALAKVQHPNVLRVLEAVEVEGKPCLVMEFLPGGSLEDRLAQGKMAADEAVRVFRDIVSGVAAAHVQGLVHRDLKPGNVLFDSNGRAKVADFGIAKWRDGGATTTLTDVGSALGTPRYMAPEQIADAGSVDARADVYSLGCMLYEMVSGESPLPNTNLLDIHNVSMDETWNPPEHAAPGMPAAVYETIRGALAGPREARIPNCETLLAVLDGFPWSRPEVDDTASQEIPKADLARTRSLSPTATTWLDEDERAVATLDPVTAPSAPDRVQRYDEELRGDTTVVESPAQNTSVWLVVAIGVFVVIPMCLAVVVVAAAVTIIMLSS